MPAVGKYLHRVSNELTELTMRTSRSTVMIRVFTEQPGQVGNGSGWIYDRDGYIVTNQHVVASAVRLEVKAPDRPWQEARLVGADEETDLAVISADGLVAPPLPLREGRAMLGELCLALGTPLGEFPESASLGIVSGLARQVGANGGPLLEEMIQTDAAINPGNSGGPLIDIAGSVLGVNTIGSRGVDNIGFATSSEVVRDIVPELIKFGAVQRSSLGISIAVEWTNVEGQDESVVSVRRVGRDDSSFLVGDVLVAIEQNAIHRRYDVKRSLNRGTVGRTIRVKVYRNGGYVDLEVTAYPR